MQYKNLILIGTSHIASHAATHVQETIQTHLPNIVALELDKKRLYSLLHPSNQKISLRDIPRIGIQGTIFAMLGAWAEKSLGAQIGTTPGVEMLAAYTAAQQCKARIALIDQDIERTLKAIKLTWKERWHFFMDILSSFIFKKNVVTFDLRTVPNDELIQQLITILKKRYPSLHHTLVVERNQFMAKQLAAILRYETEKPIIAVMGAGHVKEVMILVKKYLNTTPDKRENGLS